MMMMIINVGHAITELVTPPINTSPLLQAIRTHHRHGHRGRHDEPRCDDQQHPVCDGGVDAVLLYLLVCAIVFGVFFYVF